MIFKKALSGALGSIRRSGGVHSPLTDDGGLEPEEVGQWTYLVTDTGGIRPREEACYRKKWRNAAHRFAAGTVVEVSRRRKAGWTRWLYLASGEGWVFDISPKNRKVRMVEVEVHTGEWWYRVYIDRLAVLPWPQSGAKPATPPLHLGDLVTAIECVRPLIGQGAFLKLAGINGWVLDYANGAHTLMRIDSSTDDPGVRFRSSNSFLPVTRCPDDAYGRPETGEWNYIVLDPKGITLRGRPTYDKGAKVCSRLDEGDIVTVVERRRGANNVFLHVDDDGRTGWGFDIQPGSGSAMRMMEVAVEQGSWFYRIISDRGCVLYSRCSTSEGSKLGQGPGKGALMEIGQRAKVGGTTFLRLKDGAGWIYDHKDGKTIADGPVDVQSMRRVAATVSTEQSVHLLTAPTNQPWAQTNMVLLPNAKVQVSLEAYIEGAQWMEVSKPGGMEGWLPADCLELDCLDHWIELDSITMELERQW